MDSMVQFLGYMAEELFARAAEAAREQGVTTQEQWNDLVEQVLDDLREFQEINDDEESEEIERELRGRWPDYQATLSSEKPF